MRPLTFVLLGAALASPAAAFGWRTPQPLTSPAPRVASPKLALGFHSGIAAWDGRGGVSYALRSGDWFGAVRTLHGNLTVVDVAADNQRQVMLLAIRRLRGSYRLEVFHGRDPGGLRLWQVLDRSHLPYPSASLRGNLRGYALAAWIKQSPVAAPIKQRAVFAAVRTRGDFTAARQVSPMGVREMGIAFGGSGRTTIAWTRSRVIEARFGRGRQFGTVRRVAAVNTANGGPQLAVGGDNNSNSVIAWMQGARSISVQAVVRDHNGLHRPVDLQTWEEGLFIQRIQASFRGPGQPVVAWDGADSQGPGVFTAALRDPVQPAAQRVSPPEPFPYAVRPPKLDALATSVDNPVAIVWNRGAQLFVRYWSGSSAGYGPVEQMSAQGADSSEPALAFGWPFPFPLYGIWVVHANGASTQTVVGSIRP